VHLCSFVRIALAIPSDDDGYSRCIMYDVNFTELLSKGIREANASWPTKSCSHGWEFNFTDIPYETVATEVRKGKRKQGQKKGRYQERSALLASLSLYCINGIISLLYTCRENRRIDCRSGTKIPESQISIQSNFLLLISNRAFHM